VRLLSKFTLALNARVSSISFVIFKLKWIIIISRDFSLMHGSNMIVVSSLGLIIVLYNFFIIQEYEKTHIVIYCSVPILEFTLCAFLFVFLYMSNKIYELAGATKSNVLQHLKWRKSGIHKELRSLEIICIYVGIMNYKLLYITRCSVSTVYMTIVLYSINVLLAFEEM